MMQIKSHPDLIIFGSYQAITALFVIVDGAADEEG